MKTITEYVGTQFKAAAELQKELATLGKTAEEVPQGIGAALKLEGDRLTYFMAAIEVVGGQTSDLKRVVVYTLAEGEKAPNGAVQKGEHHYLVEYYPSMTERNQGRKFDQKKPGRGDKRGGRGGRGGERGERGAGGGGRGPGRGGERRPPAEAAKASSGKIIPRAQASGEGDKRPE